ncbi:MAG: PAS domain S-box protein [Deltaproteobacteria bacterium]|nr:PAS domain S-box protein [Deltaproteobacteria bacterium]
MSCLNNLDNTIDSKPESDMDPVLLASVFNMIGDGIYVTDEVGIIVRVNRALCALVGYTEEELIGMYAVELTPDLSGTTVDPALLESVFSTKYPQTYEALYQHRDGRLISVETNITNLPNSAAIIVSVRDITEHKKAQQQLQNVRGQIERARDFFKNTVNTVGDGIYVTDDLGYIIMANRALCEMTGYSEAALVGRFSADFYATQCETVDAEMIDAKDFERTAQRSFDGFYESISGVNTFEAYYKNRNGTVFPVELRVTEVQHFAGLSTAIVASVRDVSERKRAEQQLRQAHQDLQQSRDFLQSIFDTTGDGICVTDELGYIIMANRAMCEMTGYSREEIVGMYGSEMCPELSDPEVVQAASKYGFSLDYAQIFKAFYEKSSQGSLYELLYKRKDGSVFPVGLSITNVQDTAGETSAIIACVRDITELKQAEEQFKQTRDYLQSIIDMTGDGIYVTDDYGNIVLANDALCAMTGYAEMEIIGMYGAELCPSEDDPAVERIAEVCGSGLDFQQVAEAFYENQSSVIEAYYKRKDGSVFPVGMRVTNLHDAAGETAALIITVRDITERKLAEFELMKARDELEEKVRERTTSLQEANTALRVLLKGRDDDRQVLEEKIVTNVQELVMPHIEKLASGRLSAGQKALVEMAQSNLQDIVSPFLCSTRFLNLTSSEVQVANMIKMGRSTKEIAEIANLSIRTIEGHRDNIRKKLGIKNRKVNLRTYLLSLE